MRTENYTIGSYSQTPPPASNMFEDECVGNSQATDGLVVSRIDHSMVYIREWHIDVHFEGVDALEQFERKRQIQDFDFKFSDERKLEESDLLDGHDPVLRRQLELKLKQI